MVGRILTVVLLAAAVAATYWPALGFSFLNWDDQYVILDNAALAAPGLVGWAFTTFHIEHYQPVSWLAWAALRGTGAPDPAAYHALNLALHLVTVVLVWIVARGVFAAADLGRAASPAAVATALLYGLHPLRAEVVAWVSAMPYALATALALLAVVCWLRDARNGPALSGGAVTLFALSLLARPLAIGLPVVLATLDWWMFRRPARTSVRRASPYVILSVIAASVEAMARAPGLAEAPWLYRLQTAGAAPFVYVWHTLVPRALTPLDVLPLMPHADPVSFAASFAGLVLLSLLAWRMRDRWPAAMAVWMAYLALLAPAAGLVPSGLQATADRYTYLPGIVLTMGACGVVGAWAGRTATTRALALVAAAALSVAAALASRAVLTHWSDSVALWTRVVTLDPRNDVGHYNLGAALSAAGRRDEAASRYRTALEVNPEYAEARRQLDRLDAERLEREGNQLASAGRLEQAAARYQEALAREPRRPHAHAARGMALATLGRSAEAIPHLREAVALGVQDAAVSNTLAGLLVETGQVAEARAVLEGALKAQPNDLGLAHNLARLLLMVPGLAESDRMRAFRLAEAVAQATGGQDARALDTLAASLAGIGRMADAREINARAAAVATAQGDSELAVQITARGKGFGAAGAAPKK